MNSHDLAERLYALGYKEASVTEEQYRVFVREEPFVHKILILSNNGGSFLDWKEFLQSRILPLRSGHSAFTVALLLPKGERVSSFLAELNWVEAIWSITGHGLKTSKKTDNAEQNWIVEERLITTVLNPVRESREDKEEIVIYKPSFLPYLLLGINFIMMMIATAAGGSENVEILIKMGAKYNPRIWLGEWWRLLTPLFLHAGFLHFFMNSYALHQLGIVVNRLFGKTRFLFIYFFSGVLGSAVSAIFRPHTISVGASGAIFGLLGALIYFSMRKPATSRRLFGRSLWMALGINFVLGFTIPGIDYLAHLGGLIGGVMGGAAVGLGKKDDLKQRWVWQMACFICFLFLIGVALTPPKTNWYQPLETGRLALQAGDLTKAITNLEYSYRLNPDNHLTENYLLRAYISSLEKLYKENKLEELAMTFRRMIEIRDNWIYHFDLGDIYLRQRKYVAAKQEFEEVLKLNPGNKEAQKMLRLLEEAGH